MMNLRDEQTIIKSWSCDKDIIVSVDCTAFNHEKFIQQALDGFLSQKTSFPIEILVHDDASTDNTAVIIQEYEKKYPRLIRPIYQTENQYSKGARISFDYQFPRARGKYIAICEGDDYWTDPNKLQMQVDFLESHPDYSMCFHGAEEQNEENLYTDSEHNLVQDKDYTAEDLLDHWIIPTASIVMRRESACYPLKNPSKIVYGDYFIFFSCLALGKVRGFSRKMSVYRVNQNSITHNPKYKKNIILKMPDNWECFKENFPFAPQHAVNKILAFYYWQRASYQPTLKQSLNDRKKAFSTAPLVAFLMIFRPAVMCGISFLSKYFGGAKIRGLVRKVTSKV